MFKSLNKAISTPIAIIIVIIVAILAVGAVVLVYQYYWQPQTAPAPPEPSADETANWKTYRNEEYGFEIKYPNDWYIYANNSSDVFIQSTKEESGGIPGPHINAFEIEAKSITLNTTLLQAIQGRVDEIKKAGINFTQENIKIGGKDGLKIKTVCEGVGCGAPEWFVINGNYFYYFNSNLGYSNIFDQILSTFRFLE